MANDQALAIKWTANTIKCILCTASYTPNQNTHVFYGTVTSECAQTNGYTTGGVTVGPTGATLTYDTTNTVVIADLTDAQWTSATISAQYAVLYDLSSGTQASGQVLIGYVNFGDTMSSSNGTFTVQWSTGGVVRVTVT